METVHCLLKQGQPEGKEGELFKEHGGYITAASNYYCLEYGKKEQFRKVF